MSDDAYAFEGPPLPVEIDPQIAMRLEALETWQRTTAARLDHDHDLALAAANYAADIRRRVLGVRAQPWIANASTAVGLVTLTVGCWIVSPALCCIVLGVVLFGLPALGRLFSTGKGASHD
jgi:hypothetical protein